MALKEVSLPTGGRVWLRTRLTHGQEREREDARAAIPVGPLSRLAESLEARRAAIAADDDQRSPRPEPDDRSGLEDADVGAVTAGMRGLDEATLRVCIHHAEGVRDPDNQPLGLPGDIDRLDQEDFAFLAAAAEKALGEGSGDPNASRGSSGTPSSPDGSAETSPPTSETPS